MHFVHLISLVRMIYLLLEIYYKIIQNQMDTLDLELSIAETSWLDERREISKGWRARLPRPDIPNDQWQHWEFHKEYWKGELGYYHHAIGNECDL